MNTPLFKFASAESAAKILEGNKVFVTSPLDLNDPFEMRPAWTDAHEQCRFEDQATMASLTANWPVFVPTTNGELECIGLNNPSVQPPISVENQFGIADHNNQMVFEQFHKSFRILSFVADLFDLNASFAESKDEDTLMWSHYADKFQGVCLCIDPARLYYGLKEGGFRVSYLPTRECLPSRHYSIIPAIAGDLKDEWSHFLSQIEFLTHKSPAWSYENEVRMIYDLPILLGHSSYRQIPETDSVTEQVYHDGVHLPENALNAVVFGAECLSESVRSILAILEEPRYHSVRVFSSAIHSSRFVVQYREIERSEWRNFVQHIQEREKHIAFAKQHSGKQLGSPKGKTFVPSKALHAQA